MTSKSKTCRKESSDQDGCERNQKVKRRPTEAGNRSQRVLARVDLQSLGRSNKGRAVRTLNRLGRGRHGMEQGKS